MNKILSAVAIGVAFTWIVLPKGKVLGQEILNTSGFGSRFSPPIQLTVVGDTTNDRDRTSHGGILDPIPIRRAEQTGIHLVVPISAANSDVGIAPIDGGQVFAPQGLQVGNDGSVNFAFSAETSGLYRVIITIGGEQYLTKFYAGTVAPPDCQDN